MRRELFVLITLLVLAIFLVGCSSGEDDSSASSSSEDNDEGNEVNQGSESESGNDLSSILGSKSVKYTAEYEATMDGKKQTWVQAYDLPKFATIVRLPEGETRMIFKESVMYTCNNLQEEWMCIKLADVESTANDQIESDVKEGTAKPVYVGTCSRAGLSGQKYKVTSEGVETSICYTKKGILLEMETKDMTMYATKVSESVDPSLFTLPAEPQDFGSMFPGGIPSMN